jgi:hypothetical protein
MGLVALYTLHFFQMFQFGLKDWIGYLAGHSTGIGSHLEVKVAIDTPLDSPLVLDYPVIVPLAIRSITYNQHSMV